MTSPTERPEAELWVVDAVDDGVAVLVLADEAEELVVSEVAADLLGERAEVGVLLRVPLGDVGEPIWEEATPVPAEGGAPEGDPGEGGSAGA